MVFDLPGGSVPNFQTSCLAVDCVLSHSGSAFTGPTKWSESGLRTTTPCASAFETFCTVMTYLMSSPGGESAGTRTWMRTVGVGGSGTVRVGGDDPPGSGAPGMVNCAGCTSSSSGN